MAEKSLAGFDGLKSFRLGGPFPIKEIRKDFNIHSQFLIPNS